MKTKVQQHPRIKSYKQEVWKDIKDTNGDYQVSNLGRVKSLKTNKERILKPAIRSTRDRHLHVILCMNGVKRSWYVHHLVALTFIGDPPKQELVCCHNDDNPYNNHVGNLRWDTQLENCIEGKSTKLRKDDIGAIRAMLAEGQLTHREIGEMFGVSKHCISNISINRRWHWLKT